MVLAAQNLTIAINCKYTDLTILNYTSERLLMELEVLCIDGPHKNFAHIENTQLHQGVD